MPDPISPFSSPVFPVGVRRLAAHPNPALAVLVGRTGPVTVEDESGRVTGDALIVRPGITHHVCFAARADSAGIASVPRSRKGGMVSGGPM